MKPSWSWRYTVIAAALLLPMAAFAATDPWAESYRLEYLGKYVAAQAVIEPMVAGQAKEFAVIRSAWLLYLQGKYAESEQRYLKAIDINPRSIDAQLGMMLPQMALYRWADAIKTGRKVLDENHWDYTAHLRIMISEEAMSRWADLAKHAAEVSARFPTDATVLVYWARAEAATRNIAKAKELYSQVLERIPGHVEATKFMKNNP